MSLWWILLFHLLNLLFVSIVIALTW